MNGRKLWWVIGMAWIAATLLAAAQNDLDQKIDSNIQGGISVLRVRP